MMILFTLIGLLLIGLALPLLRRAVPPNPLYGLRVPATLLDDRVWYEANAATGRDFVVTGVMQVALALALGSVRGVSDAMYAAINAAFLAGSAIVVASIGWRRANRMRQQLQP